MKKNLYITQQNFSKICSVPVSEDVYNFINIRSIPLKKS